MILDKIENLSVYESAGFVSRTMMDFVERAKRENLPEGKYELEGNQIFALIQVYETKEREECLYESHKVYGDIQYMLEGTEMIYGANIDLLEVVEDRTPDEDILFYDRKLSGADLNQEAALVVREGSFALFLPQDGHMPCCKHKDRQTVKKIVFKFLCQ